MDIQLLDVSILFWVYSI